MHRYGLGSCDAGIPGMGVSYHCYTEIGRQAMAQQAETKAQVQPLDLGMPRFEDQTVITPPVTQNSITSQMEVHSH